MSVVDVTEARELLTRGDAVAVDVREAYEWQRGHIAGAVHIPLGQLLHRLHELPQGKRVVAVCRSGSRSWLATVELQRRGFDAVNLDGGMQRWHGQGLPLEPAAGAVA